jgi:hypothetical protein
MSRTITKSLQRTLKGFGVSRLLQSRKAATLINPTQVHPGNDQSTDKKKEPEIRTVSVTLDKTLRPDFSEENKTNIKSLLVKKQKTLSEHMDEIQLVTMKAQLEVSDLIFKDE